MFVKFHSDTRRTYKGFLAKWQPTNVRVRTDPRHTSKANGFLVSKETVVLRRWGRSKQKFGFIKRVDKG